MWGGVAGGELWGAGGRCCWVMAVLFELRPEVGALFGEVVDGGAGAVDGAGVLVDGVVDLFELVGDVVCLALFGDGGVVDHCGPSLFSLGGVECECRVGVDELVELVGDGLALAASEGGAGEPSSVEGFSELVDSKGGCPLLGDGVVGEC